jgi:hypothetical protein
MTIVNLISNHSAKIPTKEKSFVLRVFNTQYILFFLNHLNQLIIQKPIIIYLNKKLSIKNGEIGRNNLPKAKILGPQHFLAY